jgi:hypothetical protein
MAICPHTGITIPECSCFACLEAQLARVQPRLLGGYGEQTRNEEQGPARPTPQQRRAA